MTAIDDFKNLTHIGGTFEMVHADALTSFQGMGEKKVSVGGLYVVSNDVLTGCESMPLFNCGMTITKAGDDMNWSTSACGGTPLQVTGCDGVCREYMSWDFDGSFAVEDCAGTCGGTASYTSPECELDPESFECEDSIYDCGDEYTECACVSDTDSCVTSGQGCHKTLSCTNGQVVDYEIWDCQDCSGTWSGDDTSCCPSPGESFVMFSQADVLAKSAEHIACPGYTIENFQIINHDTAYEIVDLFPGLERIEGNFQLTNLGGVTAVDDFRKLNYVGGVFEVVNTESLVSIQGMGEVPVTVGEGLYVVNNDALSACYTMDIFSCQMRIKASPTQMSWVANGGTSGGCDYIDISGCDGYCGAFNGLGYDGSFTVEDCAGTCGGSAEQTTQECLDDSTSDACEWSMDACNFDPEACICIDPSAP